VAIWSFPLQIWHPPKPAPNDDNDDAEDDDDDDASGEFLLKKLMRVLFSAATCFSTLLSDAFSSYSSRRGSYGVSPSSARTPSTSTAAPTNSLISAKVRTIHNF
jgi:hypothetical protein